MSKVVEELFDVTIGGEPQKVKVVHPTSRIEAEANMLASKVFSKLAKEYSSGESGLMLRAKLDQFLRDQKLYSNEDIEEIARLSKVIEDGEKALAAGGKKSEGRKTAIEVRRARYTMLGLLAKKFEYDKNTIEHHSEMARLNYFIIRCLRFEDGSQVFGSVEDYEFDETGLKDDLAVPIRKIASLCSSYDQDYESKLPENKFFKKFGMCNDKFDLVDSEGHLVNEKGERIDENGNLIEKETKPAEFEVGEFSDD